MPTAYSTATCPAAWMSCYDYGLIVLEMLLKSERKLIRGLAQGASEQ